MGYNRQQKNEKNVIHIYSIRLNDRWSNDIECIYLIKQNNRFRR